MRLHRRLRRLSRNLSPFDPGGHLALLREDVSFRLAGHPGPGKTCVRRIDLREPRTWFRAAQYAHPADQPSIPTVPSRRGPRRVAGRAHLEGTANTDGDTRWLPPQRG